MGFVVCELDTLAGRNFASLQREIRGDVRKYGLLASEVAMWATLEVAGAASAIVTLFVVVGRVLGLMIALRGTMPVDRPEIIRALNDTGLKSRRRSMRANV